MHVLRTTELSKYILNTCVVLTFPVFVYDVYLPCGGAWGRSVVPMAFEWVGEIYGKATLFFSAYVSINAKTCLNVQT